MKKAFTLIEILTYVAVLALIILTVSSFFLWTTRSNTKAKVMRETLDNSRRAMEMMNYEIREARSIYTPTTTSTQISLETSKNLPTGELTTYLDFFLCGAQLCLKREGQNPIAITLDSVEVKKLEFTQIATTSTSPSLQINLQIDYKNPNQRPEYQASVNTTSTVSLRFY